ncbi:hypothetical protein B1R32_110102 [Abditibacterium utsteinense]|uniref:Uncharacterized protein n=1 Tax=Abditibacterium utsteinense TaxID=1960156 RepID=A0A2S8SS83_9BACT|nr:hypothetical protein [Abditibacterium utsteinense]PQV63636.1 hypothetical protein B1R32_110102 [Abditibacterium utsteinense]
MKSKSPTFALRTATSLGFCGVFAPYIWRFGWDLQSMLFLAISVAGVWEILYKRNTRKSRIEQDWELFYSSFMMLTCGLTVVGFLKFPFNDAEGIAPRPWLLAAIVVALIVGFVTFRAQAHVSNRVEKNLIVFGAPLMTLLLAIGVLNYINGALDFQNSRTFSVVIQNKRWDSGKGGRGPLVKVAFWHDKTRSEEVSVSRSAWNRAMVGAKARVRVKPGFLGAEWVESVRVD